MFDYQIIYIQLDNIFVSYMFYLEPMLDVNNHYGISDGCKISIHKYIYLIFVYYSPSDII